MGPRPSKGRDTGWPTRWKNAPEGFFKGLLDWNGTKTRLQGAEVGIAGFHSQKVAKPLLAWFARVGRDLPWRRSRQPYRVWVSEIMLQQTQVERVKDFFVRFMEAFPDVRALADAQEDEVLRLWEGLGYYRRARQMHAAAKLIVEQHGGRFPRTVAGLRMLPGIGRYTAGAIASIALGLQEPIVEANSRRVIARLAGHDRRLDGPGGDEPIWELARAMVPKQDPGLFNQALMDLGALVCTPERPRCSACPLASLCEARRTDRVAMIPPKSARRETKQVRETAVVVKRGGRVLVERRGEEEWWTGLWDFPRVPGTAVGAAKAIGRAVSLASLGCGKPRRIGRLVHTVTHHKITLDIVECTASRAGRSAAGRAWVLLAKLATLAMTAPGRRIAGMVERAECIDTKG
jgi:A/G-specific adenine glycosylase